MHFQGENLKALVVEDDPASIKALRSLLEHYGFVVSTARTTAEAIAQLQNCPKYIFLDLALPDGEGEKVLEKIRKAGINATVAVITGTSDPARLDRVEKLGADIILHKPLDFLKLLEQIKPSR